MTMTSSFSSGSVPGQIPITFRPRIHPIEEGACMLYPGDSGYEAGDISLPGPRHRLLTRPQGWEYVRS